MLLVDAPQPLVSMDWEPIPQVLACIYSHLHPRTRVMKLQLKMPNWLTLITHSVYLLLFLTVFLPKDLYSRNVRWIFFLNSWFSPLTNWRKILGNRVFFKKIFLTWPQPECTSFHDRVMVNHPEFKYHDVTRITGTPKGPLLLSHRVDSNCLCKMSIQKLAQVWTLGRQPLFNHFLLRK